MPSGFCVKGNSCGSACGMRILDTSTAHRTDSGWVYGMPELCRGQREKIKESNRVAVPGCHATGVIMLIKPLIESGLAGDDYLFPLFLLPDTAEAERK